MLVVLRLFRVVAGCSGSLLALCYAVARVFVNLWSHCAGCELGPDQRAYLQGWGVHCAAPVPRGAALFTYAGERLSNREADARLRAYDAEHVGHALLVSSSTCMTSPAASRCSALRSRTANNRRTCTDLSIDGQSNGNRRSVEGQ